MVIVKFHFRMSVADSTTALVDQADDCSHTSSSDIAKKLSEAMEESRRTEDHASVISGEGNVGYTADPPKKVRETHTNVLDRERNVGKTADPPFATCVEEDSDLFGGYTPKDTLGGGLMPVSRGTP